MMIMRMRMRTSSESSPALVADDVTFLATWAAPIVVGLLPVFVTDSSTSEEEEEEEEEEEDEEDEDDNDDDNEDEDEDFFRIITCTCG